MTRRRKNIVQEETLVDIVKTKEDAQDYFERNRYGILGVLGIAALLLGGYLFYKYGMIKPREKEALERMYQAEFQFSRDSFALALESPGGEGEGFLDIIENYGGTKAANLAKYYAGISYLNLGRNDEAIEYLNSHSATGDITPIWKNGALGDAYSEKGDFDKAISYYSKAADAKDDVSGPYFLNKLGLLKKKQGDNSGALKAFQRIKDDFPESTEGRQAEKYITMLENM
jgi:tetratricopeptide (TPR) repeat protein